MLNPQFVAGEHGLFGDHKSEDIQTFFLINIGNKETKHNKKSKVLTSQKKSLFEQKEKP